MWDGKEQTSTCLYILASVTQIHYFKYFFLISMHINFRSTHTLQYTNRLFVFPPVPPHRETYIPFLFSEYTYAWKIFFCSCYNRSEHFWQLSHHSRLARSSIQQRLSCPEILLTHIMPYLETKASVLFLTALGFFLVGHHWQQFTL